MIVAFQFTESEAKILLESLMLQEKRWRRGELVCLALGVVLVLPSLRAGLFADDVLQIAQLERWSVSEAGPLDLYTFVPRDRAVVQRLRDSGVLPYFSAPELRMVFVRPLSSALMWLDHALWGRAPVPYHVHALLWYALLLVAVALALRRAVPPSLALLALLVFCVDAGHALTVTFVAARNGTVACALTFLALNAHLRWRINGWRAGAWLAPALAALGLAAGEMALGALAYLVAWELVERRPARGRALLPTLVLVAGYLVFYRLTNSGAHASGAYLDPVGDPLGFLRELPGRLLMLLGNLLIATPIDFVVFDDRLRAPLIAAGAAIAAVVAIWLPRALGRMTGDEARAVLWMALGAAGALFASTPGLIGERLLLPASVGAAVVIAALLRDAWQLLRARRARVRAALALALLGLPNIVVAVVALPAKTLLFGAVFEDSRRTAREAEIEAPVPARVVVVALDDLLAIDLPAIRLFEQQRSAAELRALIARPDDSGLALPDRLGYRGTTVLSMASRAHRLRRTAPNELELSTPEGTMLDGTWVQVLRAPSLPLPRGTVTRTSFMTATVLDDRDGRPTRVAFRFDRPLDDPSMIFLAPLRGALRRLTLPAIGGEIEIPRRPPFGAPGH